MQVTQEKLEKMEVMDNMTKRLVCKNTYTNGNVSKAPKPGALKAPHCVKCL